VELPWAKLGALVAVAVLGAAALTGGDGSDPSSGKARIELAGRRQIVFDWSREACTRRQSADLPARAFRDARGRVQLLLSHFENFRMIGPSLSRLRVDCRPVMTSARDADPAAYRDRQWIASPYTEDGRQVWALVHDEYQGNRHPGRCPGGGYFRCWYNAITLVESHDGGRDYRARPRSTGFVAGPPYRYRPGRGQAGVFAPTNLVRRRDGRLYALVQVADPGGLPGVCLIRSGRISAHRSWRAWDGDGFNGVFTDPYREPPRSRSPCAIVAPGEIAEMTGSLTYSTTLGVYLLLGMAPSPQPHPRPPGTGIYYSTSTDLIHWSSRRLLLRVPTVHSFRCGGPEAVAYPSLLDPKSRSRTFATTGTHAFLYYTQIHYRSCHRTPDRDLVRVRVRISARAGGP
jgi:hypothetical protein